MNKISLKTRLILVTAIMSLLMAGIGLVGYRAIQDGEGRLDTLYRHQVLAMYQLHTVTSVYQISAMNTGLGVVGGKISWAEGRRILPELQRRGTQVWQEYLVTRMTEEEKLKVEELKPFIQNMEKTMDTFQTLLEQEDVQRLREFCENELRLAAEPLSSRLQFLTDFQGSAIAESIAATAKANRIQKLELLGGVTGGLLLAIILGVFLSRMAGDLSTLINQARVSGVQVNTSVTEIAATAKEQQATASEIAATTTEIGATAKEISATSRDLVKTMTEVASGAEQSATLAGSGQTGLGRMEETMRQMTEAASSINAKLATLNEKAGNINQVVTTITRVADQTNLLSLNAAIEAEKAGEYGRGFAVVATEIRRLADQTAVATYDIEQMVKEMQSAVSAGVMSMDKFSEEVRRGVEDVRQVGGQLSQIIQHVQTMTPRFELVSEGMQAQATGAQQISEALSQLSEAAQQTVETLRQSGLAIDQLNETAQGLKTGIERINI